MGAELHFPSLSAKALFKRRNSEVILDCIWSKDDSFLTLGKALDLAHRRQVVLRVLRDAIVSQINKALPFDEPRTEIGHQDGRLRREFMRAYFSKEKSYEFNDDSYDIFDRKGRVLTPQVCVDFITETFEYAAGLRWGKYGKKPAREHGTINFDHLMEPSLRRQEQSLRAYAKSHPQQFSLKDIPRSEWVRYEKSGDFFKFLRDNRQELLPGDIVIIRGRAEWDDYAVVHTHTFFIYESDPVTGVPFLIAGNAGRPRLLTWDTEMERAPKRSIRHRIRPNAEWLYDHIVIREPLLNDRYSSPLTAQAN